MNKSRFSFIVKILSILLFIIGIFAFTGSVLLWGSGFILDFPKGVDYSYPVTDIIVNAPVSLIAAVGLWRLKRYGYIASQIFSGFAIYASVEIFVKAIQGDLAGSMEIIFPQIFAVLLSIVLIVYLWRKKEEFK